MASPEQGLVLRGVRGGYGQVEVLHDVTFSVGPGEVIALLGRNGMGKTTTLMTVAGALRPFAGSITVQGTDLVGLSPHRIARLGVSLVPQGRRVFGSLTVLENLMLGSRNAGPDSTFELFPALRAKAHRLGAALSGGEQQMLAIGRALMTNPSVLLMDEPSEGIAPVMVRLIGERIQALRQHERLCIVVAEQNLGLALEVADQVCVLQEGRVAHLGSAEAFAADKALQHRLLGV